MYASVRSVHNNGCKHGVLTDYKIQCNVQTFYTEHTHIFWHTRTSPEINIQNAIGEWPDGILANHIFHSNHAKVSNLVRNVALDSKFGSCYGDINWIAKYLGWMHSKDGMIWSYAENKCLLVNMIDFCIWETMY